MGLVEMPFRKSRDPVELLKNITKTEGPELEKVFIVGVKANGDRLLACSHHDEHFMLLASKLVEDLANSVVFGQLEEAE